MGKLLKAVLAILVVILLISFLLRSNKLVLFETTYTNTAKVSFGVSFSPNYAKFLGLDWQKVYLQILDDLNVKKLRIPTFWDTIQKDPSQDNFSEVDFMLDEANKRGAKVILVVGEKQPRWPECHVPQWAKKLSISQRREKLLSFIQTVVEKYKTRENIEAWQVENEPFASWFGEGCDVPDEQFLQKEVDLVKKLDHQRKIIITDSGEWGNWVYSMKNSDILGISVYKKAYNHVINRYLIYPLPAWSYTLKSNTTKLLTGKGGKTIVTELQTEPWADKAIIDMPMEQQVENFSIKDFADNVSFAKRTGFDQIYLWGVEWWYYMAKQRFPQYLDYAKSLF